jgi:hypothetical protein
MPSEKKNFGLSVKPFMHHFHHLQIDDLWEPPLGVQTDGNPKVQGPDCMLDGRELQISAPEGFP